MLPSLEVPPPSQPLLSPQAKPLEELSEVYASAAEAQEIAAASGDPALARERLQCVLRDLAGAAALPAIAGEEPPRPPCRWVWCQLSTSRGLPCTGSCALKCKILFCAKLRLSTAVRGEKKKKALFHNHVMSPIFFLIFH